MNHKPLLDRTVRRAFLALCQNVDSPISRQAAQAVADEDWVTLTTIKVAIEDYDSPPRLSADLQIAAFFKKYPGFDLGIDLDARALESFWQSERQCFTANRLLDPLLLDREIYGEGVSAFVGRARKEVKRILRRAPSLAELDGKFGPGSTYSDIGPYITVPDKMSDSCTLTHRAHDLLDVWATTAWARYGAQGKSFVSQNPGVEKLLPVGTESYENAVDSQFAKRDPVFVRGNRFTTVPKDAWKHRGICIEPSLNVFYQLAVGTWMTKCLGKRVGWFKRGIQEYHKFLARLGSLTKSLATIDLSNASDTICTALVELLLPEDWFKLLNDLRSHYTQLPGGRWVKLEKFSSMGNGFTFELETIIFRAICVAMQEVVPDDSMHGDVVSTFGDDIIVPTVSASNVIAALNFCGLKVNRDKTFIDGDFRESCGGDYFRGLDMRPHYLKEEPSEPHQYIALANGLRRFGIRHILCGGPDLYRVPRLRVIDQIPTAIARCRGPEQLGDLVIHDDDEGSYQYTVRSSIRYIRVWRPVGFGRINWFHFRPGVVLASALYGVPDGASKSANPLRDDRMIPDGIPLRVSGTYVKGHRFGRVAYS